MKYFGEKAAYFIFGMGTGTLMTFNANQLYYVSFKRHLYDPLSNDLNEKPIKWDRLPGTLRKGFGDFYHEVI